jgi:lipopolysaccharide/colanic/teichoic acid biosynthesis glycosyltransferase
MAKPADRVYVRYSPSPRVLPGRKHSSLEFDFVSASTAGEATIVSSEPERGVAALAAGELAGAGSPIGEALSRAAIRVFDAVVAALLLAVLVPLIVLVAIAVRAESRGPAFFRCERVGYRGRRLRMLKLRKMSHDAMGVPLTTGEDARLTRIGGLLSRLKIDEIPQLLHVLRGSMSLVGPRPESPEFVSLHPQDYAEILSVPPGLTGLSQIAFVDERRILDPADPVGHYVSRILPQKIALDRMYASRRSLSFNLHILFWTAAALLVRCQVAVHRDTGKMRLRKR